ncbi:hypothetical protein ACFPAF_16475 [Hymenobacter endophyticus]|uniref:Uncharacterized protein n=1 Tax=Hymenobacter endophyticus TaxID=3076335 RepID=A0ABU3TKV2_9BACT|nr:hypothetical protein [Hymenobacter endophyticus]MDU0371999.1 hypothetical protein [Hymenobacter endophyticus]
MTSNKQVPSAAIARLLSNPELTPEQRDVYVQLSEGNLTEEEAISQVMALETARNAGEVAAIDKPATA